MQKPETPFQPEALNFVGVAAAAQSAWLAVYPDVLFGDGTTCVDGLVGQLTGEKSVGVAAFVRDVPGSRAILFVAADAKITDTARLFLLTPSTGALVQLASTSVRGGIDVYGGTVPPPNCNLRADGVAHMYCQWFRVCLTTAALDQSVTYTGRVWVHGTGLKGDPSRADPNHPVLTQIGDTLVWSGLRPTGVNPTGMVGVAGTAIQTAAAMSAVNLMTTGSGTLPPGCEE